MTEEQFNLNDFVTIAKIGKGNFGKVFKIEEKATKKTYAAKVSNEDFNDIPESDRVNLIREININAKVNHPTIIRFVGLSPKDFDGENNIVIVTELLSNGSLSKYIELESKSQAVDGWSFTQKLKIIYGIAIGMSYLHSHGIIHRDLKPDNILLDDSLNPKITDFGLSKSCDSLSLSQSGFKGTPIYTAPEIYISSDYSKAGDVYSFAIVVYELMSLKKPFSGLNFMQLCRKLDKGIRPELTKDIPEPIKDLIVRCWAQEPDDRPTFDDVVSEMKNDSKYITDEVDQEEFTSYIEYIDGCHTSFDDCKIAFKLEDFVKGSVKSIRRKTIFYQGPIDPMENIDKTDDIDNDNENVNDDDDENNNSDNDDIDDDDDGSFKTDGQQRCLTPKKVLFDESANSVLGSALEKCQSSSSFTPEPISKSKGRKRHSLSLKKTGKIMFPIIEFRSLNEKNRNLVIDAESDPNLQFIVAKNLIEGIDEFPKNPQAGVMYLKNSIKGECIESIVYYSQLLIDGLIVPQDIEKAKKLLKKNLKLKDSRIYFLYGKVLSSENNSSEAKKYFEKASKSGNAEAQFEYGKIVLGGKGVKHNTKEAVNYFAMSKLNGGNKSDLFLAVLNEMESIPKFDSLPDETQQFFITQIMNYFKGSSNITNDEKSMTPKSVHIYIPSKITSMLYTNKSLKSSAFDNVLSFFNNVSIEIKFPSKKFDSIFNIVSQKKRKQKRNLNVYLFITGTKEVDHKFGFNTIINRVIIDTSVHAIKSNAFSDCIKLKEVNMFSPLNSLGDWLFSGCSSLTKISIPSSVTSIPKRAFSCCKFLSKISIPSSIVSIKESAFYGCTSIVQLTIPSSVRSIGSGCFEECSSIQKIEIPSSVKKIRPLTFCGCKSISEILIPSDVTEINDYAFMGCIKIENIEIPSNVNLIGERCFFNCSSLKQITIPLSVSALRDFAFDGCKSLIKVRIPSSLSSSANLGINRNLLDVY